MLTRRRLLQLSGALAATGVISIGATEPSLGVTDTNISLHLWPFRRLPLDTTDKLVQKLRSLNIREAWVGSFDGLLHRDISAINQRLADECRQHSELRPVGSVNPALPGWEQDLQRCVSQHRMRIIRLHPNYHGYTLQEPSFVRLLQLASQHNLWVQLAVAMEDTRTQHSQLRVTDVDLQPLLLFKRDHPDLRLQILNHRLRAPLLQQLAALPHVYFDTARVEGTDSVPELVKAVSVGRVLFGSHAPFLIPEAALIRVHESGQLSAAELQSVYTSNARKLS